MIGTHIPPRQTEDCHGVAMRRRRDGNGNIKMKRVNTATTLSMLVLTEVLMRLRGVPSRPRTHELQMSDSVVSPEEGLGRNTALGL